MKKYLYIAASLFLLSGANSCSEGDLDMFPPNYDAIDSINTEENLQMFLNSAYLNMARANAYGAELVMFGDILSDNIYVSNFNTTYLTTYNLNYNSNQNQFGFYGTMYDAIMSCNTVINNENAGTNENITRIKAEAKILRALAYFTLVNYYSPSVASGVNQEYGVPLVLGNYDVNITPARATVAQVYDQIISDLNDGVAHADDTPQAKVTMSKTAAKLLLSKVYLSRRASGDAQKALQLSTDIVNNSPSAFQAIDAGMEDNPSMTSTYVSYFSSSSSALAENQPETIWELDINSKTNGYTGIGANIAIAAYYDRIDSKRSLVVTKALYDEINAGTDIRKGLFTLTNVPNVDDPKGAWTTKHPRLTDEGNYARNTKIMRFSEAILNRIEALYLTGDTTTALTELNKFAKRRKGAQYTGANLLNDILKERQKEFFAEGYRFLDLKRYNLPLVRNTNCTMNCNVPAGDKLFVLPVSLTSLTRNPNLTQYPGYN